MKKYLLIISCLFIYTLSYADNSAIDSTFNVQGKVVDSVSGQPLHFVSVSLLDNLTNTTPVSTVMTNEDGVFKMKHNQPGFILRFSLVGYETLTKRFDLKRGANPNPGTIRLKSSDNHLEAVVITAKKPVLELITGGYKFNAGNSIIGAGSNTTELLKQVPGLLVDEIDGDIRLLGKETTVLINGRKLNMGGRDLLAYLRSLPGNEVLSVNVLTSPGAEHEASGGGGVLDIRLKKRSKKGFFGSASTAVSTLWRTNESLNLNLKMNKTDISVGYNFSVGKNLYRRDDRIKNHALPDTNYLFLQKQMMDERQQNHSIRTQITYAVDTTSTVTIGYWYAYLYNRTPNERSTAIFNRNNDLQRRLSQHDTNILDNNFHILDAVYDKTFKSKAKLSTGFNYSDYSNKNTISFIRQAYNIDETPRNSQENENKNLAVIRPYSIWSLNADFTKSAGKTYEVRLGAKYNTAKTRSGFDSFLVREGQESIPDKNASNTIHYNEDIASAYATLTGTYNRMSFVSGIRLESFSYLLCSPTRNEQVKDKYSSVFPNASVRYESENKRSSVSLSANRRIDRPQYRLLNPFVLNDNIGYVSSGNPNLRPYFTNRVDIQFSHSYGSSHSLIFAMYGNSSSNIFSRITRYNENLGIPEINSYNDYQLKQIGSYLMLNNRLGSYGTVSTYLSAQRPFFSSGFSDDLLLSGITNFMGSVNMFIPILPKTTVQVLGFYTSAQNSFQTRNGATGYVTLGIQQKLLSDKLNLNLTLEDIFNTQEFPVSLYSGFLSLESLNKRTSRYLKLNLTYNFGQSFKTKETRKVDKESRAN